MPSERSKSAASLDRKAWTLVFVAQTIGKGSLQSLIVHAGQKRADLPVIVLGASATLQEAVDAMQLGAADFIAPPFEAELMLSRLKRLVSQSSGGEPRPVGVPTLEHFGLTGKSAAMGKVYAAVARIGRYKTNILVLGESGSGKELIARALHATGPRKNHLFVPLNCATLGREILENELFGHERGAFTGANERKKGLFELADGGTLFLDEIGELDPSTQAKLLRVIERNEFRRVGGTGKIKVDLSLIAATNRNLEEAIVAKRFREDLYYRLKVVTIRMPPLRERREDIPALIDAFIADFNRRNDGKIKGISPEALRRIAEYDWPGNVRELKNAVESAAIMATGEHDRRRRLRQRSAPRRALPKGGTTARHHRGRDDFGAGQGDPGRCGADPDRRASRPREDEDRSRANPRDRAANALHEDPAASPRRLCADGGLGSKLSAVSAVVRLKRQVGAAAGPRCARRGLARRMPPCRGPWGQIGHEATENTRQDGDDSAGSFFAGARAAFGRNGRPARAPREAHRRVPPACDEPERRRDRAP